MNAIRRVQELLAEGKMIEEVMNILSPIVTSMAKTPEILEERKARANKYLGKLDTENLGSRMAEWKELSDKEFPKPDTSPFTADEEALEVYKVKQQFLNAGEKVDTGRRRVDELVAGGMTLAEAVRTYNAELDRADPVDLMSMTIRKDDGAALDKLDENDAEYKKMYDEMSFRSAEVGKMGEGDVESRMSQYTNDEVMSNIVKKLQEERMKYLENLKKHGILEKKLADGRNILVCE